MNSHPPRSEPRSGLYVVLGRDPADSTPIPYEAKICSIDKLYRPDEIEKAQNQARLLRNTGLETNIVRIPIPRKRWVAP